jgi:hypothetical protein
MNARQRVIAALGGRCAWCQSTAGPFEIDHIHGGGNQHRAQLRLPLATWLVREHTRLGYWPTGFQLLCQALLSSAHRVWQAPPPPPRRLAVTWPLSGLCLQGGPAAGRAGGPLAGRCGGGGLPGARGGHWRVCREKWPREKWLYISYTPLCMRGYPTRSLPGV